ncbi:MAG TPA: hypothetical protein VGJ05_07910, partial [Fimbriiglobus sp.]
PEETAEILRRELKNRGFEEKADGTLARKDGGLTVTVDPCNGEVSVKSETSDTVDIHVDRQGVGFDDVGAIQTQLEAKLRRQAKEDIETKANQEKAKLQAKATADLERHLDELQPELGKVVNKVTRDALKVKAARMGNVKEIAEDEETGAMTIKVEV